MMDELETYWKYARFVKRLLFLSGIQPMREKESTLFYRILPVIAISSTVMMLFGVSQFCRNNIDNINMFTKGLSLLGSFSFLVLKVLMFLVYKKQLCELNSILEPMFKEVLDNPQLRPVILSTLKRFRYPAYIFHSLLSGTVLLYICTPLIFMLLEAIKEVQPRHYLLPYPTVFPWVDGTPGIHYQLQYLFETQFSWFLIFVTSAVDSSFGFYAFQIVGVLRALSFKCQILARSKHELEYALKNCIRKHVQLLRCRDIIQNVYGPIVFDLTLTSAVVLCALTFQVFQTEMTLAKTLLFVIYGVMKMTQVYLYAWYGSIIISEGEAFREKLYCSTWYVHGNISIMRNLLLALTQKSMILVACHFFYISLDIFVKILNTSMSYYFLLQTFEETR